MIATLTAMYWCYTVMYQILFADFSILFSTISSTISSTSCDRIKYCFYLFLVRRKPQEPCVQMELLILQFTASVLLAMNQNIMLFYLHYMLAQIILAFKLAEILMLINLKIDKLDVQHQIVNHNVLHKDFAKLK